MAVGCIFLLREGCLKMQILHHLKNVSHVLNRQRDNSSNYIQAYNGGEYLLIINFIILTISLRNKSHFIFLHLSLCVPIHFIHPFYVKSFLTFRKCNELPCIILFITLIFSITACFHSLSIFALSK